jgi:crotonobetainyl-CoA:carnitine CoA-transferase CaiB-like acyl-CoA transferase
VLDRRDLLDDPRFSDFAGRNRDRDALLPQLASIMRERTTAEWTRTLTAAGVPNGPVNGVAEALEDAQTRSRGSVVSIDHPRFGEVRQVASPLRLSGAGAALRRAPFRGEDTDAVLTEVCGYSVETVAQLRADGAFGEPGPENITTPVADRPIRRAASDG